MSPSGAPKRERMKDALNKALQAAKKHGGRRQRRLKESDKIEMEAAR